MNIILDIIKYFKTNKNYIFSLFIIVIILTVCISFNVVASNNNENEISRKHQEINSLSKQNDKIREEKEAIHDLNQTLLQKVDNLEIEINDLKEKNQTLEDSNIEMGEQIKLLHTQLNSNETDEYTSIAIIWNFLKSIGLSDYVTAGIVGNIMIECGGGTFVIHPDIINTYENAYGICQWRGGRRERLFRDFGTDIHSQCRFLSVELYEVIPKDSNFYSMQNEREAALYFAKYFERCHPDYYAIRQDSATKAYNYFVGN